MINGNRDYDGIPEINVDTDGDYIPNINIDSTGDGKPDINIDTNGDGKPDKNIKDITDWKPEKTINGDFPYDTMSFDEQDEPTNPKDDDSSTSVKGQYNPVTSIGGANTGDETELMLYLSLTMLSIGFISYAIYSYQKNTFQ